MSPRILIQSAALPLCLLVAVDAVPYVLAQSEKAKAIPDNYAVYSAILVHPPISHKDGNTKFAIAENSLQTKGYDSPAIACPHPTGVSTESLNQISADFEQRKSTTVRLKRLLSLSRPYALLSPEEVTQYHNRWVPKIQTDPPTETEVDPNAGPEDLFTFSDVFFDRDKKTAMVYVTAVCGTLCGLSGWQVVQKNQSGVWQMVQRAGCSGFIF